jgi:hypothetical protein
MYRQTGFREFREAYEGIGKLYKSRTKQYSENLTKPNIREYISKRTSDLIMSAEEFSEFSYAS